MKKIILTTVFILIFIVSFCQIETRGNFNKGLRVDGNIIYIDTFWDDMTRPASTTKLGSNNKPPYSTDSLAIVWEASDTTNDIAFYNFQIPHRWKAGTDLYAHVHYIQHSAADTCEWFSILYKWTDVGEAQSKAWSYVKSTNQTYFTYASQIHQMAMFPVIIGTGHTESSILDIKLKCWADAALYMKDFDIHFEADKPGSDNQIP